MDVAACRVERIWLLIQCESLVGGRKRVDELADRTRSSEREEGGSMGTQHTNATQIAPSFEANNVIINTNVYLSRHQEQGQAVNGSIDETCLR